MNISWSVIIQPWPDKHKMGLPVHQIFATLEEQMQILDEEPAGDPEEELDDEGQGADDLSEMKVELVEKKVQK